MEFIIARASSGDDKPTEKAYRGGPVYSWGQRWMIDINSLDELMELIKSEGELIINVDSILIYDGYVE